ncbi:MAG: hypothetical protein NT010_12735 [Proteobacteria bacterium]|nr:hypothetical protein [Pseudomonadota bacterium]
MKNGKQSIIHKILRDFQWNYGQKYQEENQERTAISLKCKIFIVLICIFFPLFYSFAGEHIIFYNTGVKDQEAWSQLKKYFDSKGYNVSIYDKAETLEKHLENANNINRTKSSLLLAMDFRIGDKDDVFVAVTDSKKGNGKFLTIEEIPAQHVVRSTEFAKCVTSSFGKTVKELPLFPLLGVDMPGVFLRMECTKGKMGETLNKLNDCFQKYFTRGIKNEK